MFIFQNLKEMDEDRRQIISDILNGDEGEDEEIKMSYDFSIYNTDFKFYSFLDRSHLIRSIYYKHFENVKTFGIMFNLSIN